MIDLSPVKQIISEILKPITDEISRFSERLNKLEEKPPEIQEPHPTFLNIYNTALVFYALRTPYKFGGTWEKDNTFDCSAYMQHIYGLWGIKLPRVSKDQAKVGQEVKFEDIQPGDTLSFDTNGDGVVNHCGMAVGNGLMIHTNNVTEGINFKSYTTSPWKGRFIVARRHW